jgi:Lon protease-like protein
LDDELLPLFPLNTVLFPGMYLPLHIFEERYRLMIRDCLEHERLFGVALIRSGAEVGGSAVPLAVGSKARIVRLDMQDDGRIYLVAQGEERFRIQEIHSEKPYLQAASIPVFDDDGSDPELPALSRATGAAFKQYIALLLSFADKWIGDFPMPTDAQEMSFYIAARLNIQPLKKQRLIEMTSARLRLQEEKEIMRQESAQLELLASTKSTSSNSNPPA